VTYFAFLDGLYYSINNPFLLQSQAVMYEKLGRRQEAMKLLQTSVKYNPTHAASWVALANLYSRKGQVSDARQCYRNAVQGDPKSYVAYQSWGVLETSLGKYNEARDLYQQALKLAPTSAYSLQAWASMELKANNLGEAERLLNRAIKALPSSTRIRLLCAELYQLKGELDKSRQVFVDGADMAIRYGDAGFFQAWASFEEKFFHLFHQESAVADTATSSLSSEAISNHNSSATSYAKPWKLSNNLDYFTRVRELYRTAVKVNKFHSSTWIAWAKFEESCDNYGNLLSNHHSSALAHSLRVL
jgi:tetratricopeptide (TPR) repeat protein